MKSTSRNLLFAALLLPVLGLMALYAFYKSPEVSNTPSTLVAPNESSTPNTPNTLDEPITNSAPEATNIDNPSVAPQKSHTPNFVDIKYRETPVDIAHPRFEFLDTSSSSFIQGAWYDKSESYMVINLSGTNYHYCGMSLSAWKGLSSAESKGSYYNDNIKGNFDCRINPVPSYN